MLVCANVHLKEYEDRDGNVIVPETRLERVCVLETSGIWMEVVLTMVEDEEGKLRAELLKVVTVSPAQRCRIVRCRRIGSIGHRIRVTSRAAVVRQSLVGAE